MDYVYGPGRNHLFVPGPVNIPEQVLRAMNRNNEDYRSPAIPAMTKILLEDVKKIFKTTSGTSFLFPTTGTFLHLSSWVLDYDVLVQVRSLPFGACVTCACSFHRICLRNKLV